MKKYTYILIILFFSLQNLLAQTITKEETAFFDALILAKSNTTIYKINIDNLTLSSCLKDTGILNDTNKFAKKIELIKTNDSYRDNFYGMLNYYYSGNEKMLYNNLQIYNISTDPFTHVTSENDMNTLVTNIKNAKYNYEFEYFKRIDTTRETESVYKDTINIKIAAFKGGDIEYINYIRKNIIYPEFEKEADISGNVLISFIIEKDGGISSVKCIKKVSRGLDCEAMRVVKLMPKWIPATYKNKPIRMWYQTPIRFILQ